MENNNKIEYGGFWIRFLSSIIDTILLTLIILPILLHIYGMNYFYSTAFIKGPMDFIITYVLPCLVFVIFWHFKSATPGKMLCRLIIVDAKTLQKPTVRQSMIRYLGYYLSTIPLCLGFLWIAFDKRKQGWHDKLAHTVVLKKHSLHKR